MSKQTARTRNENSTSQATPGQGIIVPKGLSFPHYALVPLRDVGSCPIAICEVILPPRVLGTLAAGATFVVTGIFFREDDELVLRGYFEIDMHREEYTQPSYR